MLILNWKKSSDALLMFVYFLFGIMNPKNSVLRMYIPTPGEETLKSIYIH